MAWLCFAHFKPTFCFLTHSKYNGWTWKSSGYTKCAWWRSCWDNCIICCTEGQRMCCEVDERNCMHHTKSVCKWAAPVYLLQRHCVDNFSSCNRSNGRKLLVPHNLRQNLALGNFPAFIAAFSLPSCPVVFEGMQRYFCSCSISLWQFQVWLAWSSMAPGLPLYNGVEVHCELVWLAVNLRAWVVCDLRMTFRDAPSRTAFWWLCFIAHS